MVSDLRGLLTRLGFVYTHDEFYEPTGLRHPSYMLARSQWPPNLALNTDSHRRTSDRTGKAG